MIDKIVIDNFATIEHLEADIGPSLNIITGETGAGKSVLVQAINIALGGRADMSMIRTGTKKAVIQIAAHYTDEEYHDVIIQRELFSSGKSINKLNGEMITLAKLREFCSGLVDVHGQYDNQKILNRDNHIDLLDSFCADEISGELAELRKLYSAYTESKREYDSLIKEETGARRQHDFNQFEYDYIDKLDPKPGEDEELREQLDMMKNSEKIFSAVNSTYEMLRDSEVSVMDQIGRGAEEMKSVASFSEDLSKVSSELEDIYYRLEDISSDLREQRDVMDFSEEDIDSVSERLSEIEDAKRKYNTDIDGILEYKQELEEKLLLVSSFDEKKKELKDAMDSSYSALKDQGSKVSRIRKSSAKQLEKAMKKELTDLNFASSDFGIEIKKLDHIEQNGFDDVEFLISTNPGEPLRPLIQIASGGEISRIMLAFKHITGDKDKVPTMIFDEIDTGISGKTALVVGKKLREISGYHQIICITHLPQIAAYGSDNYAIVKTLSGGKSSTAIEHLDEDGKVRKIASLISGDEESSSALKAARELIANVN